MNTLLWILQGVLALKMISTAFIHAFRRDLATMESAAAQLGTISELLLSLSALLSLSVGAALVLPALMGWKPGITPWAAAVLAGLLMVSIPLHLASREDPQIFVSVILGGMAAFLAYGRWTLIPF